MQTKCSECNFRVKNFEGKAPCSFSKEPNNGMRSRKATLRFQRKRAQNATFEREGKVMETHAAPLIIARVAPKHIRAWLSSSGFWSIGFVSGKLKLVLAICGLGWGGCFVGRRFINGKKGLIRAPFFGELTAASCMMASTGQFLVVSLSSETSPFRAQLVAKLVKQLG